ncbi:MAG: hypothetical protein UV40_C0023G0009 [Parcubacteria group bacterium GW2011_GWA1_42_7]|nr:MAG: hypothetical protein UV40_C0023G0009 [Parcubacteria group bacterium GW2011_GWA1_42_7]
MRLNFERSKDSPLNILRRMGYSFLKHTPQGEMSFVKRVGYDDFPRFHVFSKMDQKGNVSLTLHLDQKGASYGGSFAHSGEYENEGVLEKEAEAIKKEFLNPKL